MGEEEAASPCPDTIAAQAVASGRDGTKDTKKYTNMHQPASVERKVSSEVTEEYEDDAGNKTENIKEEKYSENLTGCPLNSEKKSFYGKYLGSNQLTM